MAGFFAAVTQAPFTSFIIVMEMIDGHEMVISLMAIALIASIVSRVFSTSLYSTLADKQLSRRRAKQSKAGQAKAKLIQKQIQVTQARLEQLIQQQAQHTIEAKKVKSRTHLLLLRLIV